MQAVTLAPHEFGANFLFIEHGLTPFFAADSQVKAGGGSQVAEFEADGERWVCKLYYQDSGIVHPGCQTPTGTEMRLDELREFRFSIARHPEEDSIGAGIFILPAIAAEGAGPASSISFAIAGFVALLAAVSLAELATGMPISGGSYHYINRGLGGFFGSIVGWGMWTGLMFASAFYMVGFGQYIVETAPFLDGRTLVVLVGLAGLVLILGINYYGTERNRRHDGHRLRHLPRVRDHRHGRWRNQRPRTTHPPTVLGVFLHGVTPQRGDGSVVSEDRRSVRSRRTTVGPDQIGA